MFTGLSAFPPHPLADDAVDEAAFTGPVRRLVAAQVDSVTAHSSVPVIVYDNPGTTHFTFSTELYGRIGQLPGIASIKIPGVLADPQQAGHGSARSAR